jgi:hypothetical protein
MFIKLETKKQNQLKQKFNLGKSCCQSWWNLPEKNKKQKRLKEGTIWMANYLKLPTNKEKEYSKDMKIKNKKMQNQQ